MKTSEDKRMFPKHTVVRTVNKIEIFAKTDKKKEYVIAFLAPIAPEGVRVFMRMSKAQKLAAFANVNLMQGGRAAVSKSMRAHARAEGGEKVTKGMVDKAVERITASQYEIGLQLLAAHWDKGVSTDNWIYITTKAKNEFGYMVKQAARSTKPLKRKAEIPMKNTIVKIEPDAKKPRKAEAIIDVTGGNDRAPKRGKWSDADEETFASLLDDLSNLSRRIAQVTLARRNGVSIAEHDAQAKRSARR